MNVKVTIERSKEWLRKKRLETGENVPDTIEVEVPVAELRQEVREALLLTGNGCYPGTLDQFGYNKKYGIQGRWSGYMPYGWERFTIDLDSPSASDVDAALHSAIERIAEHKRQSEVQAAERAAAAAAAKAEQEERDRRVAEARELLATELQAGAAAAEMVDLLTSLLAETPVDALRGAVRRLVLRQEGITEAGLIKRIEDASSQWIFSNREDDDE